MNRAARVIVFVQQYPNRWIKAVNFEEVGGRQAWRTAISEARLRLEAAGTGTIENRVRRVIPSWGEQKPFLLSEYRFVPRAPVVADATTVDDATGWSLT